MYVVSYQISFLLFSHKTLLFRWFFCDKYKVPILYIHISTGYILKVDVGFSIYIETFPVLWINIEYSIRMNVTVFFLLGILCSIEGEYNIYSWSNSHDLPSWITIVLRNVNIFRMTECIAKCKNIQFKCNGDIVLLCNTPKTVYMSKFDSFIISNFKETARNSSA